MYMMNTEYLIISYYVTIKSNIWAIKCNLHLGILCNVKLRHVIICQLVM
jgi:hypothetical protein